MQSFPHSESSTDTTNATAEMFLKHLFKKKLKKNAASLSCCGEEKKSRVELQTCISLLQLYSIYFPFAK